MPTASKKKTVKPAGGKRVGAKARKPGGKRPPVKKSAAKKPAARRAGAVVSAPLAAPGSPEQFRARVRMYRQGLGDCFLITFPRRDRAPFHLLIDCGALGRKSDFMTSIVEHIRDTVRADQGGQKARVDVVVATHEHKDHLSGFNQARRVFNDEFDFGAVWLGWTENLTKPEIKKIKETRKKAVAKLTAALQTPLALASGALANAAAVLGFSQDEDETGSGKISEALEYLKARGKDARDLRYLHPGGEPFELDGVEGVRVYVLGPPPDPILLKGSEVTEQMKKDGIVYHLSGLGEAGMDGLSAALASAPGSLEERYHPFAAEHRIVQPRSARAAPAPQSSVYFKAIRPFVNKTYDDPAQAWRRIDDDWLAAFGQLALDLDNDTNNTSLVLAFEFVETREVLLFVGDAQVGNWQSWAQLSFQVPGREQPVPAHDLLARTVFYKVGHHCSHNATLRAGGLELMCSDDLVAFIPLDRETAGKQGKTGWDMPAVPLFKALQEKTAKRVVISDVKEQLTPEAASAGVVATDTFIDYFLR